MSVTVPEIIAHYSPMGSSAGDVLSTGTVSGVAAFSGDPKSLYLKPGDVVECEIEKIGVLRNPVVSFKERYGGRYRWGAGGFIRCCTFSFLVREDVFAGQARMLACVVLA